MVTSTRPAVILVARADQVSCETQLSHRANGDEDKEEWVVMGLNVRHSSKSSGRIGTGRS